MSPKTRNIIGWVLTALLAALFIFSAYNKFFGGPDAETHAAAFGMTAATMKMLGCIELLSLLLFIIPRTGVLGTLLLGAYLGGAVATHLEHGQSVTMPIIIAIIGVITALIRFPELGHRLFDKNIRH